MRAPEETQRYTAAASRAALELYRTRLVSAEEAVRVVQSHDRVWISAGQSVSLILSALTARAFELEDVEVKWLPSADYGWGGDAFEGHLRSNVVFASVFSRDDVNRGAADYTPWFVYGGHKALEDGREDARPIDVALVSVTPPNEWGYVCLGHSLWDSRDTARLAKTVIAEVHDELPRTYGDSWLHVSEIDLFVDHDGPPPERAWRTPQPDPWDAAIAEHVASLVRDGDTLQLGTGSTTGYIPVSGALDGKRDLGYFAELTVPGTVELVQKGVITGARMATHPGKFVTTTAGNSTDDLAFINGNPMFEFYSPAYIHHPGAIARNDNLVAVNNAITIDLTGQIGAANIGARVWSGTGGHLSYAMGAYLSHGGRYICVLPSTAVGGTRSRVVPQLEQGQIVTVPRDLADYVVSEFGIARLLGKTQRERARELIAIAHPDFRADLEREAERLL
ncbi:MAG: acetyl-CoA hydrolase/transferase family protein [Chloroflexi bacterium]|nr:acetyl-CoA hydrolase/transferase family protein [Chloroflexota bacterium]MBM4435567.1 acetyl-CoA hydrolase/transferase family protein [Chloroflexota bacterium]